MRFRTLPLVAAALGALLPCAVASAQDATPIRIGEINSYTGALAGFTTGYRQAFDLAIAQANDKGGALGRRLEVIYRDDNISAADASRMANELVLNQKVDLLAGTFLSPSGMAVASYAQQNHKLFVATEPLTDAITWSKGSRYVFRVQSPVSMVAEALAVKAAGLQCTKWAGTGPVSEAITDLFNDFRADMAGKAPGFQWSGEVMAPVGRFNAGTTVAQFQRNGVDCLVNSHVGPDLVALIREMKARGYDSRVKVVSIQTGLPEWLQSLGAEAPVGWTVSGYPVRDVPWPAHRQFVADFRGRYGQDPSFGAFIGFLSAQSIVAGIQRAGAVDVESLVKGFRGAEFPCIIGQCRWRLDHQLDLGVWVGGVKVEDGKPSMVDWTYITGEQGLPPEREGMARRPPGAND